MYCTEIIKTTWLIFSSETPTLLYYSHIPTAFIAIFLGIFVFFSNRESISNKIFFALNIAYGSLIFLNLILWTNSYIPTIAFVWPFTQVLFVLIPVLSLYFFYVFMNKKDVGLVYKIIWSSIVIILTILASSKLNFSSFDATICEPITSKIVFIYQNIVFALVYIALIFSFIKKYLSKSLPKDERKELVFLFWGIFLFLVSFTITWQIAEAYDSFNTEQYGLFGMTLLLAVVSFLIVRFKAFDIKLIGAQALVWALIILIGSLFAYTDQAPFSMLVIIAITLVISAIVGLIIVRGVKREISLRESLEISNKGQENLIHIMNHQIKGFLGTARNIFAEFLTSDQSSIYGPLPELPEEATSALKVGLRTTTDGVRYVTDILRGSSASKGSLALEMKPMDTKVIVEELIVELQPLAKEWNVVLEGTVASGEYKIIGDHTQLKEVFKNLITNAIRHNDPDYKHKSAKVSLLRKGNKILFAVRDTGNGIAPEDRARMFTPGGMGQDALKHDVNSTGFGLSFVKSCVLSHNGIVDYKSNAPEKGTTFFVELPADLSK